MVDVTSMDVFREFIVISDHVSPVYRAYEQNEDLFKKAQPILLAPINGYEPKKLHYKNRIRYISNPFTFHSRFVLEKKKKLERIFEKFKYRLKTL